MYKSSKIISLLILVFTLLIGCKTSDPLSLIVNDRDIYFESGASTSTIKITTNATQLTFNTDANWLKINQLAISNGNKDVSFTVIENATGKTRIAVVKIGAESAETQLVYVTQKSTLYPNYNSFPQSADATEMSSNAMELSKKFNLGWNIGNTLEAIGGETNWGNPKITNELIQLVKKNGFNSVRLPCSWDQYADPSTAEIKISWLNRIKEVVQMCVNNDMYVVLNIHWDGGWLENNCTPEKQVANNAKQKALWQQIATHLRDFDEHLLLASTNEPNVDNATQMAVLNSYHQTFVDAVRATGGKNTYRVLVIQGPSTDIEKTNKLFTTMPTDKIANRLMAEIHFYTPWQFCGLTKDESWGSQFYYWGKDYHSTIDLSRNPTWGEEGDVDKYFGLMKSQFVDKGIPVIVGEFSVTRRTNLTGESLKLHLASRAFYLKYVTKQALNNGLTPFYWDNGGLDTYSSGIFNRKDNSIFDQLALDALIQGAKK